MLLMSKDFNLICEKSLHNQEFGEAEFINVGWGKVETQFHGSEGKQAAQMKKERKFNEVHYEWDDKKPKIDWKTDAECYVISSIDIETNARKFQIFTRDGVLHSTSEYVVSMEPIISWKNSKALLTTATHKANKHEIVFYEPNGLAHGGFTLPFMMKEYKISGLYWNNDSSVLCVWCEKLDSNTRENQSLCRLRLS
jgi:elongator complex protein 1